MNAKHTPIVVLLSTMLLVITVLYTLPICADSNPPQRLTRMHMTPDEILELPPLPSKEQLSTIGGSKGRLDATFISRQLADLYGVSAFLESMPPAGSQDTYYVPFIDVQISTESTTTVRKYLDRISSEDTIQWGFVHGQLAIWPTSYPAELENYLDIPISLELDGVTFVDALTAWAAETVSKRKTGKGILLRVMPLPILDREGKDVFRGAHPAMLEPGVVSVTLHEVTAREALCAILAQSPVFIRVLYTHSLTEGTPRDMLSIRFRGDMIEELPVIDEEDYWEFRSEVLKAALFESEIPR